MRDFMLIFIGVDYEQSNLSPDEMQQRAQKWFAWGDKMKEQDVLRGGNALQGGGKQIIGPNRTVTDRVSTELKEVIGGYYLVSARDYDHAVEISQDYPDYDLGGTVEIREIQVYG